MPSNMLILYGYLMFPLVCTVRKARGKTSFLLKALLLLLLAQIILFKILIYHI